MSLGVLNNLNAVYAENNLNNTSNSLSKVLNQLSSGSKINSGADDAAGLSLVDGLQANSMALSQSQTNATEGVGILTVADGALSQVTNLLNRAVTLATEASNGTLNSSQDTAANQEYQSILSEINNIGTTTTYNQQQVFGSTTNIFTGDSSSVGASIDSLNIRSLSSSNIGDTNGQMSYSNGTNNVFINLSSGGNNAALTDSLGAANATTTINVGYMTTGAGGSAVAASAAISVGAGTNYANTAEGLISAINNSGLGLNATFATAADSGSAAVASAKTAGGSGTDTGIEISAAGIGTGTNGVGVVGALALGAGQTLSGSLNIVGSGGTSHNIALGTANSTDNLTNLASTINAAGYGVTASVNQAGTQLTFTTANSAVSITGTNVAANTAATSTTATIEGSGLGSLTVGGASDTLSGTLNVTSGVDGTTGHVITLGTTGSTDTLANLAASFSGSGANAGLGISAALTNNGTTINFTKSTADANTPSITASGVTDTATPSIVAGTTLGSLSVSSAGDTLGATDVTSGTTSTLTIKSGLTGATSSLNLGTAGSTDTLANLAQTINAGGYGITATLDKTGTDLTFTQNAGNTFAAGVTGSAIDTTYTTTPIAIVASTTLGSITVAGANDTVKGVYVESTTAAHAAGTELDLSVSGQTLAQIADDFNNGAQKGSGITAVITNNGDTLTFEGNGAQTNGGNTVSLSTTSGGGSPTTSFTDTVGSATSVANIVTTPGGANLGTLSVTNASNILTGNLNITSGTTGVTYNANNADALSVTGQTLAQIAATLNTTANQSKYGITATLNAAGTELTFTANTAKADVDSAEAAISTNTFTPSTLTTQVGTQIAAITTETSSATDVFTGTIKGTNASGTAYTLQENDVTQAQLVTDLGTEGITAHANSTTAMELTQTSGDQDKPTITSYSIGETTGAVVNAAVTSAVVAPNLGNSYTVGTITADNVGDLLSGTLTGTNAAGTAWTATFSDQTQTQINTYFNSGAGSGDGLAASLATDVQTFKAASGTSQATLTASTLSDITYTPGTLDVATTNTAAASPLQTITTTSGALGGNINITSAVTGLTSTVNLTAGQTLAQIAADFNTTGGTQNLHAYGLAATVNGTILDLSQASNANPYTASVAGVGATVAASLTQTSVVATGTTLGSLSATQPNDTLAGTFTIQSGLTAGATPQSVAFNGTLTQIMNQINQGGYGITAALNTSANSTAATTAGTVLTFTQTAGDLGTASITNNGVVLDTTPQATNTPLDVSSPNSTLGTNAASTPAAQLTNLGTLVSTTAGDVLSGTLNLTEATDGLATQSQYNFSGQTIQEIANQFNSLDGGQYANLGITATVNAGSYTTGGNTYAAGTILTFTQNTVGEGTAAVSGTGITDLTPPATVNQTVTTGTLLDTISLGNSTDTISGDIKLQQGLTTGGTLAAVVITAGQTLTQLAADFNTSGGTQNLSTYGITAAVSGNTLTLTQTVGDLGTANVTSDATTPIIDTLAVASQTSTGTYNTTGTLLNSITAAAASDTLTGTLKIQEGSDTNKTISTYNLAGQTVAEVAAAFNTGAQKGLGITATVSGTANNILTFTQTTSDPGTANVTDSTAIVDQTANTGYTNTVPVSGKTLLDTLSVNNATDTLGGTLNLTSGLTGLAAPAITLGTAGSTDTLANLASTINGGGYGITATLNTAQTELTLTQNSGDGFTAAATGTSISDSGSTKLAASSSLGTLTANTAADTLAGALNIVGANGSTAYNLQVNGQTLSQLATTINSDSAYGITATLNQTGTGLSFASTSGDTGTPTIANVGPITDTTGAITTSIYLTDTPTTGVPNSSTLGSVSIASTETLSGSLKIGSQTINIGTSDNTAATLASTINQGSYGVQAAYNANSGQLSFTSPNASVAVSTASLNETALGASSSTPVGSLTGASTASGYYSVGVTGNVADTSTLGGTSKIAIAANTNGSGGTATISYDDAAGQSLISTTLSNQTSAQSALTAINLAITDVAAQDGYIGAQINTLNSVSSVLATQAENVTSAQNAVQATDYASATSNMSKYEILSQTGISALAQANSMQQEVTKLLQ